MDMSFRAATPSERNYAYSQSQQIAIQTGCIGHLRGDMDSNGKGFFTSWDDFRKDLKTDEFKALTKKLRGELAERYMENFTPAYVTLNSI